MTLIDKAEALLPCPFCGEVPAIKERGENIALFVCASPPCKGSSMFMGFVREDREKAIAAWNRRTALAPTDAAQAEDSYPYDGPEQCERDLEDTAAQALEAALEWVKKHGIHAEDCDTVTRQDEFDLDFDMETICTCGLTAILRAMEGRDG